jgi:hypothetical protein
MSDQDNILKFKRAPAPAKKRPAVDHDWVSSLDPLAAVRRAMAADPAVARAIEEINRGSIQSIVRKAMSK